MNKILNLKNVYFLNEVNRNRTDGNKKDYRDLTSDDIRYQNVEKLVREHGSNLFVTYTTIDKIGINPRSKFDTPIGVYAYPVDQFKTKNIISGDMPFVGLSPYKFIKFFILKDTDKVVTVDKSGNTNRDKDFDNIISKLIAAEPDLEINARSSKLQTPLGRFWNITRTIANNPVSWNKILKGYGIDAVVDYGTGIIHGSEPVQAVMLNTTIIEPVYTIENKVDEDLGYNEFLNKLDTFVKNQDKLSFIRKMSQQSKNNEIRQFTKDFLRKRDEKILASSNKNINTKELTKLLYGETPEERENVANNPDTPPEALMRLAGDEDFFIRYVVARNPNTPPEALIVLADDKKDTVKHGVMENPSTPLEALMKLASDKNAYIRTAALKLIKVK